MVRYYRYIFLVIFPCSEIPSQWTFLMNFLRGELVAVNLPCGELMAMNLLVIIYYIVKNIPKTEPFPGKNAE